MYGTKFIVNEIYYIFTYFILEFIKWFSLIIVVQSSLITTKQGRIQRGGLKAMVMYKLYIAIIHIIILKKVHCSLLFMQFSNCIDGYKLTIFMFVWLVIYTQ